MVIKNNFSHVGAAPRSTVRQGSVPASPHDLDRLRERFTQAVADRVRKRSEAFLFDGESLQRGLHRLNRYMRDIGVSVHAEPLLHSRRFVHER